MATTHTTTRNDRSNAMKDAENILGNTLATGLVLLAAGLAVLGLLVGFDVIDTDNPFNNGFLWLISAVVAGLCSNTFRREHHIVDDHDLHDVRPSGRNL